MIQFAFLGIFVSSSQNTIHRFDHLIAGLGYTPKEVPIPPGSGHPAAKQYLYRGSARKGHGHIVFGSYSNTESAKAMYASFVSRTSVMPPDRSLSSLILGDRVSSTSSASRGEVKSSTVMAHLENAFCFVALYQQSARIGDPTNVDVDTIVEYTCRRILAEKVGEQLSPRSTVTIGGSNFEAMTYKDGATYVRLSDWFIARNAAGVSNGWHGSIVSARVGSKDIKVAGAAKGLQINGQWKTLSNPVLYRDSAWWVPLAGFQALVP